MGDNITLGHSRDPVYLAQELNREVSEMRDELDNHFRTITALLWGIGFLALLLLLRMLGL